MCGSLEIDSAIDTVRSLSQEMREAQILPGETAESCALELAESSKTVGSSMAQLLTVASQGKGRSGVSQDKGRVVDII